MVDSECCDGAESIDVNAFCKRLRQEITGVSWSEVMHFAEVLRAAIRAAERNAAGGAAVPEEILRRLFFASTIIFAPDVVPEVHAFLSANLAASGLLRLAGAKRDG